MSEPICQHCRRPKSDHHVFEIGPPNGTPDCGCFHDGRWIDTDGAVCTGSEADDWVFCRKCRHDWACHKGIT